MKLLDFRTVSAAIFTLSISLPAICRAEPSTAIFNVNQYGAAGAVVIGTCSGQAGSQLLTGCGFGSSSDFAVGQGIHIYAGGNPVQELSITSEYQKSVTVTQYPTNGTTALGSHSYCYVVRVADPLEGITKPSVPVCVSNEPDLSTGGTFNALDVTTTNSSYGAASVGPAATFLWYVSKDGQPYYICAIAGPGQGNYGKSTASAFAIDVGQNIGNRGGWPTPLAVGTQQGQKDEDFYSYVTAVNGSQVSINDPLPKAITNNQVLSDDTRAVQSAINAAVSAGGGTVQFNNGVYAISRPSFVESKTNGSNYYTYTTNLQDSPYAFGFSYLQIPNGTPGHVHLAGMGANTTIITGADHGGQATFLSVGFFGRPSDDLLPAYPSGVIPINPVQKGATQITLTSAVSPALAPGDDVWLYSGSYGSPCPNTTRSDGAVTPGGQCHYSELNTVQSVSGATITLQYPASKQYYNDGYSSFGMVKMPITPHDIALQALQINTFNPILGVGLVYNLLVDGVVINGQVRSPFGGGYKRQVTIQNSSWTFGAGDATAANEDEYDQFTDVYFTNNTISGYAALGAEGPSEQARIYGTEGSSHFVFQNNTFNKVGLFFDQTTDDVFTNNHFNDSEVMMGVAYVPASTTACTNAASQNFTYASYASQANADVEMNTFNSDASYAPPALVRLGNFDTATVANNTLSYAGAPNIAVISTYSGAVSGNSIGISGVSTSSVGICLVPDESPNKNPTSFAVRNNGVQAANAAAGIYIPNVGFNDPAPTCIEGNIYQAQTGAPVVVASPQSVNLSCPN